MTGQAARPDLGAYRRFVVAFSGGKDSLAALLHLLSLGVPPHAIELHHHDVDGHGPTFMDWPCTLSYVRAIADHFEIALYCSWRDGGFARELARADAPTAPIIFETPRGFGRAGGNGPAGTRGLFPQTSPDLRVRWCSSALKIDVLAAAIRNQPRFSQGRTLVITGERAEESPSRARYATFEPHRTSTLARAVDHWRPVHDWTEEQVWAAIERSGVRPHPAYVLGWGRLSCRACIFGSPDQWATIRLVFPTAFARIAACEAASGKTIHRSLSVVQLADRGTPFPAALLHPDQLAQANDPAWRLSILADPWTLPAGAFGDQAGPV
ncbi:phosphoadenosine phosphosulfate reductase family protein [Sphingomonas sp. 2R-10]|uniref:phosphoadenosine phosphosulfate reductase domain-containing protein n=1 Tax=Sphingomonas sp. 2R-10 TaxID=3045148 RepID=UPI0024BBDE2D|nr:phosphoadenosine phosphosulfate reductase family protein [Sphingomonas sp. 2R-10]MDJ0275970.1 phosphoadenosine phosphosulfate reductase family protein [Sphingomonas sp. 2R-10]